MAVEIEKTRTVAGLRLPAAGRWEFDSGHSEVAFEGRHLMVSKIRGRFTRFQGHLDVAEVPEDSTAELTIEAASVESAVEERDSHLRGAGWFDAEQHPVISARVANLRHIDGDRWAGAGTLSLRGIERPVVLDVTFHGIAQDPWGGDRLGFTVVTEVDREAWGMTWNQTSESGGVVVGRTVRLILNIEAVLKA
ncbi:MAG: YceI family protein [Candidatus Dormibacteraceae bacterium]